MSGAMIRNPQQQARPSRVATQARAFSLLSALPFAGGRKEAVRAERKEALLDLLPKDRGVSGKNQDEIESAISALESVNPTPSPLSSDLVNGKWELLYTTSKSVLGTNKLPFLRPSGPIYQIIDAKALRAQNLETAPLFNQVTANLVPVSRSKVKVKFDTFKIFGLVGVKAPDSAVGELDVTYLDEDLRISRGDKGNVFVLRMKERGVTVK